MRECRKLYHISRYAFSRLRGSGEVTYLVEPNRLAGKEVYVFSRSNAGHLTVMKASGDDLIKEKKEYSIVRDEELKELELGDRSPRFQQYVSSNWHYIEGMRREILQSKPYRLAGHLTAHPGTHALLENTFKGYWYCASWPTDRARLRCISQLMKYLHQIWCAILIAEALGITELLETGSIEVRQGSPYPTLAFKDSKERIWSEWVEAQWVEISEDQIKMLRTDILLAKGDWRHKIQVHNLRGVKTEIIAECKHEEWIKWWNKETTDQLRKYVKAFKPKHALLITLRKTPQHIKQAVAKLGYKTLDEIQPNRTEKLTNYLQTI